MTLFLNRCIWNPTAGGITDFVVASAFAGAYTPAQCLDPVVTDGGNYHYFAQTADNTQHEEGDGIYSVATGTLTRATIRNSSSGGVKVNFSQAPIVTMGGPTSLEILPIQVNPTTTPNTLTIQAPTVAAANANTAGQLFSINGSYSTGIGEPGFVAFNTGYVGYDVGRTLTSISNGSPAIFTSPTPHYLFGLQCILLQTTGTLPSPLATLTQYFVDTASLTATTFEVATTINGTPVNTTSAGSGTHSYVPGGVVTAIFNFGGPTIFQCPFAAGLTQGMPVQFQSTGVLPTGLLPNTTYFVSGVQGSGGSGANFSVATTRTTAGLTCTGGSGTLTFQVQGDVQNIPIPGLAFTIGPGTLTGNDSSPFFHVFQTWNTTKEQLFGTGQALQALTINNLRADFQTSCFAQYQAVGTSLNVFNVQSVPNATGGAWQIYPGNGLNGPPAIEFHNANWPDFTLNLVGQPIQMGTVTSTTGPAAGPPGIGLLIGYDNANGIFSLLNTTISSPAGLRVYNITDSTTGAPTNYERVVADFVTTPNVGTFGTQAGGSGTVRDFAIVKGANTFLTSQTATVGTLPAAGAGLTGARRFVTDSNATLTAGIGAIVATGGANVVPVFCDGTNWRIG